MPLFHTNLLTPLVGGGVRWSPGVYIRIEGNRIEAIHEQTREPAEERLHQVCLPGFIDTHAHLSQLHARGRYSAGLLDWLRDHIFPEEMRSADEHYARSTSRDYFASMLAQGTTTAVLYISVFPQATEVAFEEADRAGVRAFIGKVMMDANCPPELMEDTEAGLRSSMALYERWNGATPLLHYIFSPRFAPVCTERLMSRLGAFVAESGAFLQTHLAENRDELDLVRSLFPQAGSYTDVYSRCGLLGPHTLLGHGIHLSDAELLTIADSGAAITHCPDSNFFLNSGQFPWRRVQQAGIRFALATDVGAGTTLSMPEMMRMAAYRQEGWAPAPDELFRRATLEGARLLGLEAEIGSIEPGKAADLIFVENLLQPTLDTVLSRLVYGNRELTVAEAWVAGRRVL